jgi:hypothetical protein
VNPDPDSYGPFAEAAGAAGYQQDASADPWMPTRWMASPVSSVAGAMDVWVFNDMMQQWQQLHVIQPGQTLYHTLSASYYAGGPNLANTRAIINVPQNTPIVGGAGDRAQAGDVILIPNLPQAGLPNAAAVPPTPIGQVPINARGPGQPPMTLPEVLGAPAPEPVPGLPPPGEIPGAPVPGAPAPTPVGFPVEKPGWWPAGVPWPGETAPAAPAPAPPTEPTPAPPGVPAPPGLPAPPGALPVPAPTPAETIAKEKEKEKEEEKFWTGGKIAIAALGGAGLVALIYYFATRKPKRGRRRTRRRRRRRR